VKQKRKSKDLFIGDSGVGITCLIDRVARDECKSGLSRTVVPGGTDVVIEPCPFVFWDTAGEIPLLGQSLLPVCLCFSVEETETFDSVAKSCAEVTEGRPNWDFIRDGLSHGSALRHCELPEPGGQVEHRGSARDVRRSHSSEFPSFFTPPIAI
jgi:hypothetical protein